MSKKAIIKRKLTIGNPNQFTIDLSSLLWYTLNDNKIVVVAEKANHPKGWGAKL